jgi:hypothetical protein
MLWPGCSAASNRPVAPIVGRLDPGPTGPISCISCQRASDIQHFQQGLAAFALTSAIGAKQAAIG